MLKRFIPALLFLTLPFSVDAQNFTRQDTLRGSITPERAWWDLNFYHLNIKVDPAQRFISGSNLIRYKVLQPAQVMQIDLQPPLKLEKATQSSKQLQVKTEGNAHFITLQEKQIPGSFNQVEVFYSGNPKMSKNPPWSGGFTWQQDPNGKPFVATSCQGEGASLWWPCKDHMYDEPDSMQISVTAPENLTAVANGRLRKTDTNKDGSKTFHWAVVNPINNYGVNVNLGDYVHFGEKFQGEKGTLDCDYYVLRDNLTKAKEQFKQVPLMLKAFEYWFGPYPFYDDSYKLVEVPYLGMEHQSSVTYGNGYKNGYLGRDPSGTSWGLKFDFIIIHESGHEWFANNITYKDIADMWIHESFTNYSEALYVDYHFGTKAGNEYVIGLRKNIANDRPIIGTYNVNHEGSGDMYYKGANMLHTIRQLVNNDQKFREILRGLNKDFYHQTVTTRQIEDYLSQKSGLNLKPVFDQYLRDVRIPKLEYRTEKNKISYRWVNCVKGFNMPVKCYVNGQEKWFTPTTEWQELKGLPKKITFKTDENFYINTAVISSK
jgi:aminopeptidase N